jgi:hypothetical protein
MSRIRYASLASVLGFCLVLASLTSCKKDDPVANRPPETRLFVDTIARSGANRLTTQVHLHWSADDPDGFVKGFELSTDGTTWSFTTRTDSLFSFQIAAATDTFDVQFWVRAIDDQDTPDPSPAYLRLPLRNSAPVIKFLTSVAPRDSVFSVLTLSWTVSDLEGVETLDDIEIRVNEGNWLNLPPTLTRVSLRALTPTATGTVTAQVFNGSAALNGTLSDFRLDAPNVVYVRARDNGGLVSAIDTSKTVFVRRQTSNVLVLDTWNGNPSASAAYLPILNSAATFGGVDYINLTDTNNVPKLLSVTFGLLLAQYDAVFWTANRNTLSLFEESESILQQHLNRGGKLLLVLPLASTIDTTTSAVFRLAPITGIASTMANARLAGNGVGLLVPQSPAGDGYPQLANENASFITSINPVWPSASGEVVYRGSLIQPNGDPWTDTNVLCVKSRNGPNVNVIYCGVPLHQLGPLAGLEAFFLKVKQEFGL